MIFYCDSKIRKDWKTIFSNLHHKWKAIYSCLHDVTLVWFQYFSFKGHAVLNWHVCLFFIMLPFFASFPWIPFPYVSYSLITLSFFSFSLFVLSVLIYPHWLFLWVSITDWYFKKKSFFLTSLQSLLFQAMVLLGLTSCCFKSASPCVFVCAHERFIQKKFLT